MSKPVTLHLATDTIYLDSEDGGRYVSSDQVALNAFGDLLSLISRNDESSGLHLSAACRAILSENSKAAPDEVAYIPSRLFEGQSHPLPQVCAELRSEFGQILGDRRSGRSFGALQLTKLTDLLHYSARVMEITLTPQGFPTTARPSPSAGARHPIDIVAITGATLLKERSEGIPNIWRYDAIGHSAMTLPDEELSCYSGVIEAARVSLGTEPSAVLVLAAVPWRTLSRYPAGAGFLLLDAGALLGTLHLVACGLGIAACPVAVSALGLDEPDVALDSRVPVVGFAIGGVDATAHLPKRL